MKKFCLGLAASLLMVLPLTAGVDTPAAPGTVSIFTGAEVNFHSPGGLGPTVVPGLELGVYQWEIVPGMALDFTAAARGFLSGYYYNIYLDYTYGRAFTGLGGYLGLHYSFKGLKSKIDLVDALDFYGGFGWGGALAFVLGSYADFYNSLYGQTIGTGFQAAHGPAGYAGLAWFPAKTWGLTLEYNNFAASSGVGLGLVLKLSPQTGKPAVSEDTPKAPAAPIRKPAPPSVKPVKPGKTR